MTIEVTVEELKEITKALDFRGDHRSDEKKAQELYDLAQRLRELRRKTEGKI